MSTVADKVKLTPEAKAIVKQAIANIRSAPDQFDMRHWLGKNCSPKELRTCGTSACLAGHIALAALDNKTRSIVRNQYVKQSVLEKKLPALASIFPTETVAVGSNYVPAVEISMVAGKLLNLDTAEEQMRLFDAWSWPYPYSDQYMALADKQDSPTVLRKRAAVAIRRLKHYLKTGE